MNERGEAEGKRQICREPCPLKRSTTRKRGCGRRKKSTVSLNRSGQTPQPRKLWISECHRNWGVTIMEQQKEIYFEDLPLNVQEILIELIVSAIKNSISEKVEEDQQ